MARSKRPSNAAVKAALRVLTPHLAHVLQTTAWGVKHFGAIVAGADCRRRDFLALERRGLVARIGSVVVCDDDGFLKVPESYREGWKLTDAGANAVTAKEARVRRGE